MLQLPRYQPQFAWLERYINKRYPGQEAASLLHFPFHSLCFYLTTAFSPFHPLCMRVYVSWWYSSPGPRISPFLSLPQFSPTSLLFSGKENEHESWAYRVGKHRLYESLLWYLSIVCSSLLLFCFSLFLSLSFVALLSFISYILLLGARC